MSERLTSSFCLLGCGSGVRSHFGRYFYRALSALRGAPDSVHRTLRALFLALDIAPRASPRENAASALVDPPLGVNSIDEGAVTPAYAPLAPLADPARHASMISRMLSDGSPLSAQSSGDPASSSNRPTAA